ncbi:HU family DNA-binding protein [Prosthecomicrobium hirschii]|uniref:HU family DNA-binding protein n=1 Tax=Prosthecodimorpha hirschii TaxID=665126 RepID=UPI00221FBF0B|nr:HU family DNA-binding protein [Prosthecomicrobium hirschii]MCW1844176.1 HU family DNA-binding protein [Prosthecomicrobium hirschii]
MDTIEKVVDAFAQKFGGQDGPLSKKDARTGLQNFAEFVTDGLKAGGVVKLPGFGEFRVKETKPRTARNPQTGAAVQVPAKNKVVFKAASDLRNQI